MASELHFVLMIAAILSSGWILNHVTQTSLSNSKLELFNHWTEQHNKVYSTPEEKQYRFEIFSKNYDFIQSENLKKTNTYTLGLTQFADLTNLEFKALHLRTSATPKVSSTPTTYVKSKVITESENATGSLPASVDWVAKGDVTPVVNQGQCGSSVVFDAVDAIASAYAIANGTLVSLPYEQVIECLGGGTCAGSDVSIDQVFAYVEQYGLEEDYQSNGTCNYDPSKVVVRISGFTDVSSDDDNALLQAVAQQPVAAGIEADSTTFQFYTSGVITSSSCGTEIDHSVLIVGYGTENGINYWKVKNSWGQSWGEDGYVFIKRQSGEGPGECGIAIEASYPTI